jgi:phosphatidylglycerophosphatase A
LTALAPAGIVQDVVENPLSPPAVARRPPLWALLVATALGAGLVPLAPGTWGTLVAMPLAWWLGRMGEVAYLAAAVLVTVVGTIAADVYCRATGRHDNQQIVVDEVAGYLVTLAAVPRDLPDLVVGFALFRLFDIWKPPPVRAIDRRVHGGFGVVADDLAAGVYAALVLAALHYSGALPSLAARLGLG